MNDDAILETRSLCKSFPGVKALDQINLTIRKGEVHALLGENGAGKSTLVKIISGAYRKDSGDIYFEGESRDFASTIESYKNGISIIYQETSLIPQLNVIQNVFLGMEHANSCFNIINDKRIKEEYARTCERVGFGFPGSRPVKNLGVAEQKMVEILKALVRNAKFVIMDEPTDTLSESEANRLFDIIAELKKNRITVLYITHILEEVFRIADSITVLRDGKKVDTVRTGDIDKNGIIKMMVGHSFLESLPEAKGKAMRKEALRVENLCKKGVINDVSFSAFSGEILGITGLIGAGKTELARLMFGADKLDSGRIYVDHQLCRISSPRAAIKNKIYMLPEDRKDSGLIQKHDVSQNITLASLDSLSNGLYLSGEKELQIAREMIGRLNIKVSGMNQLVSNLSGGNQQKVVIAKGLAARPKIFILDEPTRGIDVNAKQEVHKIMKELAGAGACIIFFSAEVDEIARVCDRILILKSGTITDELPQGTTQSKIMQIILEG